MKRQKRIVPPADIILDVINDEPQADEVVLKFYDSYILAAAKEPHYSSCGEFIDHIVNPDLAQDMRMALVRCLPSLREAFQKKYFRKNPVVVVIAKEEID